MSVATAKKLPFDWLTFLYITGIHLAALLAFLPNFFNWSAVGVAFMMHWITAGIGVTLGFHRLLSHRSLEVPKWLEYFLVFCGSLSAQGGVIACMVGAGSDLDDDPLLGSARLSQKCQAR